MSCTFRFFDDQGLQWQLFFISSWHTVEATVTHYHLRRRTTKDRLQLVG